MTVLETVNHINERAGFHSIYRVDIADEDFYLITHSDHVLELGTKDVVEFWRAEDR